MASKYDKIVKSDPRSPRYFKACDVARIAENCVEDTGTPEYVVLACVAKRLGFKRIWVDDKEEALHSDEYDHVKAMQQFYVDTTTDIEKSGGVFTGVQRVGAGYLIQRAAARFAALVENEIAVESATIVSALEYGYTAWINWVLWRMLQLFNNLPSFLTGFFAEWIINTITWLGGLLEGLFTILSVDVDDVLRANQDWCSCEQPELAGFTVDEDAAKEFDKGKKSTGKSGTSKKPKPLPNPGGV